MESSLCFQSELTREAAQAAVEEAGCTMMTASKDFNLTHASVNRST